MSRFYRQAGKLARSVAIPWLTVVLILLGYGLMTSSAVRKSATPDEQSHLFRGVAYLKTGATHFRLGHPILGGVLTGLPLLTEPELQMAVDDPSWAAGNWSVAGDLFLWQKNANPQRLIFLGRLPVMWLTLLLGALVYRWGRELAGGRAGVLAMALLFLDPNMLAHGRLVTTDLMMTAFFTLAVYGYWRWTQDNRLGSLLLTGLGAGLAGAAKYNAGLLLPVLGVLGLAIAIRRRTWKPLMALVAAGAFAWFVIWLVYGFACRPLPGGAFWDDLQWVLTYFDKPHGAYLAGSYSAEGWWYYFPVAFLLKTPLPTLLLLGLAVWYAALTISRSLRGVNGRKGTSFSQLAFLFVPASLYFVASMASKLNIGYRHLLPILPFLALFVAVVLARAYGSYASFLPVVPLLIALFAWPDYLSYFNLLTAGSTGGWRILSDSNVDWGQDLPALADWQQESGERVKLSYFGMAHPSAYGVDFDPLPTWSPGPEQGDPSCRSFNPADPAPGWYAISVTNLHGAVLGEKRDTFAWFREREPFDRLGGSIFIYQVEARGEPVNVAYAGLRPDELDPQLALWETNDMRPRCFDAGTSFLWPAGGGWLLRAPDLAPDPALPFWPKDPVAQAPGQALYQVAAPPELFLQGEAADLGGVLAFLGYQRQDAPPGEVALLTAWRVLSPTKRPLKIYVHALDEDGTIVGQWDGLGVLPGSWQQDDLFVHLHRFRVVKPMTIIKLAIGIYDGKTLDRLAENLILRD